MFLFFQETAENYSNSDNLISSALDDDVQQVILENKLGCDVYLREFEQNSESTKFLPHNGHVSLFLPTPRFLDKLNVVANSRESRYYVAIQILESEVIQLYLFLYSYSKSTVLDIILFHTSAGANYSGWWQ